MDARVCLSACVQFAHKEDIRLVSGAMNRIQARFQPLSPGLKHVIVHAVDLDEHRLVAAWRVGVTCSMPEVAKSYDIMLRVGKGVNKVRVWRGGPTVNLSHVQALPC
jgi:hypothetical protein